MNQRTPVMGSSVYRLQDLFTTILPWDGQKFTLEPRRVECTEWRTGYAAHAEIGPYCSVHTANGDRYSLQVSATEEVIRVVHENTIMDMRTRITFALIGWQDGRTLLVARHNLILSDVWVAFVDSASIPGEVAL